MSNAIAIKTHTNPGDEVLMDAEGHTMIYEVGHPAVVSGIMARQFSSTMGVPDIEDILRWTHPGDLHRPPTVLLVLENTHNRSGGYFIPIEVHRHLAETSRSAKVQIHLDGARLFNAAVAMNVLVSEIALYADTVTFCLSKGLGAPIGSVLCGSVDFIRRARRVRTMLGGGMRQVGLIAAAGIYALENNVERLSEDHARARTLAQSLVDIPGVQIETTTPPTNMIYFQTVSPALEFAEKMKSQGVWVIATGAHRVRMITHLDVDDVGISRASEVIRNVAAATAVLLQRG